MESPFSESVLNFEVEKEFPFNFREIEVLLKDD